ncbi:hypothetical protein AU512_16475 [Lonsdalea iberica]|uniref:Uncharacterized protein n=1 Tax=Lonsdalea iberica TaxID=1082703 RepID=A0ABX3XD17_9GAMM|nr:hypothetical protein AU512_16475 [Lonsdalea iberica]
MLMLPEPVIEPKVKLVGGPDLAAMVNQRMTLHFALRMAGAYLHTEAILLTNQRETHTDRQLIAAAPALSLYLAPRSA